MSLTQSSVFEQGRDANFQGLSSPIPAPGNEKPGLAGFVC